MRKRLLLAMVIGLTSALVVAAPVAANDTECGTPPPQEPGDPFEPEVLTGMHDNIVVRSGTLCILEGADVRGNVRVLEGGQVVALDSTVLGSITADPAAGIFMDATTVNGNVTGEQEASVFVDFSTVHGNVQTKTDAATGGTGSTVHGSYTCDGCFFQDLFDTTVRGNVTVRSAEIGDFMCGNTFGANVEIYDSRSAADEFFTFAFELVDNDVAGSVIVKNNVGPLVVDDNRIGANLQVSNNNVGFAAAYPDEGCLQSTPSDNGEILRNVVAGNVQITKNLGEIEITLNSITGSLQCSNNSPPPVGGGNIAAQKQGQCRGL